MNHDDVYYALQDKLHDKEARIRELEGLLNRHVDLQVGSLNAEEEDQLREETFKALSRTSDEGTGYNEVAGEVYQAVGVLLSDAGRFDDPDGIVLLDACSYLAGNRDNPPDSLLPFESKGTRCVVPEAVRRLPEDWRREAEELGEHAETVVAQTMAYRMLGRAAQMRKSADKLDRAIAEQGEQEWSGVPEDRAAATWLMARIIERHTEKPPGPPDPPFDRQPEWVRKAYYRQAERAIAEQGGQRVLEAVNVVFDGPPGPTPGRFVEVETDDGKSVRVGEWIERDDGLWALRIDRAIAQQGK